jgi:hypothetical protein
VERGPRHFAGVSPCLRPASVSANLCARPTPPLTALCFDMEEALNEAFDAAHATHLIGHGLREFANESEARAVACTAWLACQKVEALQQIWRDLFKAAARATS